MSAVFVGGGSLDIAQLTRGRQVVIDFELVCLLARRVDYLWGRIQGLGRIRNVWKTTMDVTRQTTNSFDFEFHRAIFVVVIVLDTGQWKQRRHIKGL